MKYLRILLLLMILATLVHADLWEEYRDTLKGIEDAKDTPQKRKAQLRKTLTSNLQRALFRYFNYPDYKKIKASDFIFEHDNLPFTGDYYV